MGDRSASAKSILELDKHLARVRRREGAGGHQLRRARARGARDHRPQRRRQELDAERDQRRLPSAAGHHHLPRQEAARHGHARRRGAGHRAHVPEHRAVQGHDGARQHHDRAQPEDERNFLQQAIWWGRARSEELVHRRKVEQVIDFLEIEHIRKTPVGRLPYGLQKRVELARALAAEPSCCCSTSRWRA